MKAFANTVLTAFAAAGVALTATPALAADEILDFSGAVCINLPCSPGGGISQSYGDMAGLDVQYRSLTGQGNSSVSYNGLNFWSTGYGDLENVIWGGDNDMVGVPEIRFVAAGGETVTINSFDMAGWPAADHSSSVRIFDLAYNLLFEIQSLVAPGQGHLTISPGVSNAGGLILQWGPSGYNAGLDNISISVGGGVPEPATWVLLILGLGAVGAALRRRRGLVPSAA